MFILYTKLYQFNKKHFDYKKIKLVQNAKIKHVNDNVANFVQAYIKKQAEKFEDPAFQKYIKSENDKKKLEDIFLIAPYSMKMRMLNNMPDEKQKLISNLIKDDKVDTCTKTIIENLEIA